MAGKNDPVRKFEHEKLIFPRIDDPLLLALQRFYRPNDFPYYSLIHKGVKFTEWVGVIRVGDLTIEVLPKIDKVEADCDWQRVLIDMLQTVGLINMKAPSTAGLNLKSNSILDLYIELFLNEVSQLMREGLIKTYRKREANQLAIKGRLMFARQIRHNLVHAERFHTCHTIYDKAHLLNQILRKALKVLKSINTNPALSGTIGRLLLDFPELEDLSVSDATFEKIQFNRKSEGYRNAIEIARLILLNYHPDLVRGQNEVLAIMFDMNKLWESYVEQSLRKVKQDLYKVCAQYEKNFFKPEGRRVRNLKPDIVLEPRNPSSGLKSIVIDTKWKMPGSLTASMDDLRQVFVYNQYYGAKKGVLLYPGPVRKELTGAFLQTSGETCKALSDSILKDGKLDFGFGGRFFEAILQE
ncbi:MAG: restriction endonuclease [Bacteroidia bacterium]|nr:restriction endonuclease [Bacteroidia bacterium]